MCKTFNVGQAVRGCLAMFVACGIRTSVAARHATFPASSLLCPPKPLSLSVYSYEVLSPHYESEPATRRSRRVANTLPRVVGKMVILIWKAAQHAACRRPLAVRMDIR